MAVLVSPRCHILSGRTVLEIFLSSLGLLKMSGHKLGPGT